MEKKKVIGFYDYTVILTYLGLLFAFIGILNAINENFVYSIICLMLAGICDMFDGAVASTKERNVYEKHFGIQIDSLCDLVSFGALPAIFVYMFEDRNMTVGILSCAYLLCALIRLAYYNVQEFDRQQQTTGKRDYFLGVPVTTVAILLPLIYCICSQFSVESKISYTVMLAVLAAGFISGVQIKKPQAIGKVVLIALGLGELIDIIRLIFA